VWIESHSLRPGWIIDTGDNPEPLLDAIRTHGITPQAILFTHAHLDHIMGLAKVILIGLPFSRVAGEYRGHTASASAQEIPPHFGE
jgi:glyoxylase-like metal-dependent hydrolase (beta-lactamase superfamily II)